jgi:hypothetical protein
MILVALWKAQSYYFLMKLVPRQRRSPQLHKLERRMSIAYLLHEHIAILLLMYICVKRLLAFVEEFDVAVAFNAPRVSSRGQALYR